MSEGLRNRVRQTRNGRPGADMPPDAGTLDVARRSLIDDLRRMEAELGKAIPPGSMSAEQLVRDVITTLRDKPELCEPDVNPQTVLGAAMTCAQLGLRPGVAGECWILPFKNQNSGRTEATFVAGYRGLAALAHRSGLIRGLTARTVFEKELPKFRLVWRHDGDELSHEPFLLDDPGAPVLYYARVLLPDGGYQMTRPTSHRMMLAHRDRHVSIKSGPWYDATGQAGCGFESMAWKTEIKRLAKLMPLSPQLASAMSADGGVRRNVSPNAVIHEVTEPGVDHDPDSASDDVTSGQSREVEADLWHGTDTIAPTREDRCDA